LSRGETAAPHPALSPEGRGWLRFSLSLQGEGPGVRGGCLSEAEGVSLKISRK